MELHKNGLDLSCLLGIPLPDSAAIDCVKALNIGDDKKRLILDGVAKGQRSEAGAGVLAALVRAGYDDILITFIFDHYPIGEKYREKGSGRNRWLKDEIARVHGFVQTRLATSAGNVPASQPEPWEPELIPWPVLSPAARPGLIGALVELATRDSEADPAAVLATALVRFGAEVYGCTPGQGPVIEVGETRHFPRLFAAIVGASAKARKGTSAGPVKTAFDFSTVSGALEAAYLPATCGNGPFSTGEGLVYCVRDSRKEWIVDKKDGSGSWVETDPGVTDKRLFVLDEEMVAALKCMKREGNTLSAALRAAWDHGNYAPMTKSERTTTTNAHINIVFHITTQELQRHLEEVDALNGFGNRFLWVCARRQKMVPFPARMPEAELAAIRHELFRAVRLAQGRGVIGLDATARDLWQTVYPKLTEDHPGLAGCIINRGEAQALRLALIYALLDGQNNIAERHLRAGLAFWDYCRDSALYVFGNRDANPLAQKILAALGDGPKATTDLHKALGNNVARDKIKTALQELLASGRILQSEEKTASKPRKMFSLNEQYEVYEFSPKAESGGRNSSDTSYTSYVSGKENDPVAGPGEVLL